MSQKILYIEDEEQIGKMQIERLKQASFEARWVESISAAEEIAKTFQPDLLLVDNGLQEGKQGIEAIPDLKQFFPKAKIVIYSNYENKQKKDQAKELGADNYWVKLEVRGESLVQAITELLK